MRKDAPPKPIAKGTGVGAAKAAEPVPEKTMGSFGALLQESLNKKR